LTTRQISDIRVEVEVRNVRAQMPRGTNRAV
jgi:hypothetical protein